MTQVNSSMFALSNLMHWNAWVVAALCGLLDCVFADMIYAVNGRYIATVIIVTVDTFLSSKGVVWPFVQAKSK